MARTHRLSMPGRKAVLRAVASLALVCLLAALGGVIGRVCVADRALLRDILVGIEDNYAEIESATGVFVMTFEVSDDPLFAKEKEALEQGTQRIWWALENRSFREERVALVDGKESGDPQIYASDGNLGYEWHMGPNRGVVYEDINRTVVGSLVSSWMHLGHRHLDDESALSARLENAPDLTVVGREDVDDLDCFILMAGRDGDHPETLWIAPERGYCVKKHERVMPAPYGRAGIKMGRWTQVVEEFARADGGPYLPSKETRVFTAVMADGTEVEGIRQTLTAEELSINVPPEPGLFEVSFAMSTKVHRPGDSRGEGDEVEVGQLQR